MDPKSPATHGDLLALRELIELRFDSLDREEKLRAEALEIARSEMNRRLDGMNEFREQINKLEGTFVKREEYVTAHRTLETRLEDSTKQAENRLRALERLVYIGAGAAFIINALLVYFLKRG